MAERARGIAVIGEFRTTAGHVASGLDSDNFSKSMGAMKVVLPTKALDANGVLGPVTLKARRLSDMEPEGIVNQCAPSKPVLDGRGSLTAIKGPLGCEKAVIMRLRHALDDEQARDTYRRSLSPDRVCGAVDVFRDDAYGSALRAALESFVLPGETEPYLDTLLAINRVDRESEGYPIAWRGLAALVTQLIHPDWLRVPPYKAAIDRMIFEVDVRLGEFVRAVLHEPVFRAAELAWRAVRRLVELGEVADVVSAPFDDVDRALPSALASLPTAPRAIAVLHDADPVADDAWIRAVMRAAPSDAAVVFQLDDTLAERAAREPAFGRRVADAFRRALKDADASRASLCASRVLVRYPYGADSIPTRSFNFEEFDEASPIDPRALAYAPAAPFRAAELRPSPTPRRPPVMTSYERLEGDAIVSFPVFTKDPLL